MNAASISPSRLGNVGLLSALTVLSIAYALFGPMPGSTLPVAEETMQTQTFLANEKLDPEVMHALKIVAQSQRPLRHAALELPPLTEEVQPSLEEQPREQLLSHVVKPGETLFQIWKQYGAPKMGGSRAAEAWKEAGVTLQGLRPGDELKLTLRNGDIAEVHRLLRNGDEIILKGDSKNGYTASLRKVQVTESEFTASGVITSSFAGDARNASVPYGVIDDLVDLLGTRLEFRRDLQPGDYFTVTYKQRLVGGKALEESSGQTIVAASINRGTNMFAVIRHTGKDGVSRYFDERGAPVGNYFLRYPVQFSHISSAFSTARFHPLLQRFRPHNGIDFAAPIGTAVRAVADGIVREAGFRGEAGNTIRLSHGSRYSTAYLHLSKIFSGVRPGMRVTRGQIIGAVGMSGLATGPHLHFSLYDGGRYIDPLKAALPNLGTELEHLPREVLVTALNSFRNLQQALMLASAAPAGKARKLG